MNNNALDQYRLLGRFGLRVSPMVQQLMFGGTAVATRDRAVV